jgi:pilus assembly protein Flp/PilA
MRRYARSIANWFSLTSERGVTAIEYGLIASLIAVVIIAGITLIGTNLQTVFAYIAGKISAPT